MTLEKALKVLQSHNIDTTEKDGKVFAACNFTEDGETVYTIWDEVTEKNGAVTIHNIPIYDWLGY